MTDETEAVDLNAIRGRQKRALVSVSQERPNEYDPDHCNRAAYILAVTDVPALMAEVDRLNDTIRRIVAVRNAAIRQRADLADLVRDMKRLLTVPGDPSDEAIVRERAEALLAKVPPRLPEYTDAEIAEIERNGGWE